MTGSYKDLFSFRVLLINSVIIIILESISIFDYYMLNLQIKYANGNIFDNIIYAGLSDMTSIFLSSFIYNYAGVKASFVGIYGI